MHRRLPLPALLLTLLAVTATGCSGVWLGVARLPDKDDLFITTGDVPYEYQPVGLVRVHTQRLIFCVRDIDAVYVDLEEDIRRELVKKAKALGATAIINLETNEHLFPLFCGMAPTALPPVEMITITGLAIKRTGSAPAPAPLSDG